MCITLVKQCFDNGKELKMFILISKEAIFHFMDLVTLGYFNICTVQFSSTVYWMY